LTFHFNLIFTRRFNLMNQTQKITTMLLLVLLISSGAYAQYIPGKERGDPAYRAKAQMEGNQVRASIFNEGLTGREDGNHPISVQTPYEWPKNSGEVYLAMTQMWVGGEVFQDNDSTTLHIINVANGRTSPQGKSWNWEPVPGYYNDNRSGGRVIATSTDPSSWPAFWPDKLTDSIDPGWRGKWNGYFGKDKFNADMEMFYRTSDSRYNRYQQYFPDSTDLSRRGLGINFDCRTLAWSQILVQDDIFHLYTIKNDGTKDITKVAVTIWYADFVGGNGDSNDDISQYDLTDDIAWSRDSDNRAPDFGNDPVGAIAVVFLETPGNATDRIDNDGDGEQGGPKVTQEMLSGEDPLNQIDDNHNGLVDESQAHIAFLQQTGVSYADGIDNNGNAESGSPVITQQIVDQAASDNYSGYNWYRWPPRPETDAIQQGKINLIEVGSDDIGRAFKDGIDNNDNGEDNSPVITQAIIDQAAQDAPYFRYKVPGSTIILYDVTAADLGNKYADGIDNNGDGAIDENIDEGIDEMIDERRDDHIDNDGDWDVMTDDVGLDGIADTHDFGEGDGKPTSGAGTGLPGEPNIDVTDVSETDQIGITSAKYEPANTLNILSDQYMWNDFMIPGNFYDPALITPGEYDLYVTSTYFPLKSGQTEPISLAVVLANAPVPDPNGDLRKAAILNKRQKAQETYNNDYQFANAPITPTLTAVPGDNRVTLYWDDAAENSFDNFINNIGGEGRDFEGYRIYRSSDPAFQDVYTITNGYGTKQFNNPMEIFDLVDGIKGFDPIGLDGVHFNLGNDTGLKHTFVDSTAKNGFTYYYAVTSYDFGYPAGNIIPTESAIRISLKADGSVELGQNVARVVPEAPAAGFEAANLGNIQLIQGTTSSTVNYSVIDQNKIKEGHVYFITFEDTTIAGAPGKPDTLTTKNYTLTDSTANTVLVDKNPNFVSTYEQPVTDGFQLQFNNARSVGINQSLSGWNHKGEIPNFAFEKFTLNNVSGEQRPNDYEIIFGDVGFGQSTQITVNTLPTPRTYPSKPVNFKVYNRSTQQFIEFGFNELDTTFGTPGMLSSDTAAHRDRIIFLEPNNQDSLVFTWWFYLLDAPDTNQRIPQAGDTVYIILDKPFLSSDKFRFVAHKDKIDIEQAKKDLEKIKVVPNPYVASALWEAKNPYNSGRGPRSLHFTHLPNKCTIRIFTVSGELVTELHHDSQFNDGTEDWNMLQRDNLSISYGVYVYQVDAPGIGEKIGKFAVIK
jgi:hypothetical protein